MAEREVPLIKSFHVEFLEGRLTITAETGEELHYRISPLEQESPAVQQASETSQRDDVVTAAEVPQLQEEAQKTFTLTGRIKGAGKGKPAVIEGRSDGKGNPTAWTRFAAHQEGSEEAWMLSTTFHRAATRIALGLSLNDQITVAGYVRPSQAPGRMDSLSVFHMIDYPNKPAKSPDQS